MDSLFNPAMTRLPATLFFGVLALVIAAVWAGLVAARREARWPVFVAALLGLVAWGVAVVGLFWDGNTLGGSILLGSLAFVALAAGLTFLINEYSWLTAVVFGLLALGAAVAPNGELGLWLAGGFAFTLLCLAAAVWLGIGWWAPLSYAVAGFTLLGLGGVTGQVTGAGLSVFARNITSVRAAEPWWLLLLGLIPVLIWWSTRSLAGLGGARRAIALTLRSLLVVFLTLALAEVYLLHTNDTLTVLYVWDQSLSMPEETDPLDKDVNLAAKRLLTFINNSVAQRGSKHQRDNAGLIVFGRYPRLELPPSSVPHFRLSKVSSTIDESYTDIAAALKLALACFPEGTGKRIVLISDGNENLGKAEEQARIAKQNNIEIDSVLVSSSNRNQNEIVLERIEAPSLADTDTRMPIRIVVRSYVPQTVIAKLSLFKTSLKMPASGQGAVDFTNKQVGEELLVPLRLGLNVFYLEQPGLREEESYVYRAKVEPLGLPLKGFDIKNPDLAKLDAGPIKLDRWQNNYASATVLARGEKKVLLIEPTLGDHKLLTDTLRRSKSNLKVGTITPGQLPLDPEKLNFFLSGFDCIILANVPRDLVTPEQDAALRTCVHEQGCGLIMIGGRNGFGGGGWQNTEVEKALPVTCDLKSLKVEGRSGLVLIMHASEIQEGNMWQKKIAELAIKKLSPIDMMGLLYFDASNGDHRWHIPFQTVGEGRNKMLGLLNTMAPGDMPDADPSLIKAYNALTDPLHQLGTKHIIFISDGDHWKPPLGTLQKIKAAKITVTTVCITSHGQGEFRNMGTVARVTGGREYPAPNAAGEYKALKPEELPAIYIKETRLISQSFFHEKPFFPELLQRAGPTEGFPKDLPQLHGFVRTSPRPGPLVQLPIMSPKLGEDKWPILAHWQYGLGKGVAFTSDALTQPGSPSWDRDWANSDLYAKFWDQLVGWSLRELDNNKGLNMTTELRDGKVRITVEARDEDFKPRSDLEVIVRVTSPDPKAGDSSRPNIKLEQKNAGIYEAEIRAEDVGSYFLTALASRNKRVKGPDGKMQVVQEPIGVLRAAVTIPYSPEFAEMQSNTALLERLSALTGGKTYRDDADELAEVASTGGVFRLPPTQSRSLQNIWYWLLTLTGIGLFFDVAVRRIAIDPVQASEMARARWQRLRGQAVVSTPDAMLDRLKSRKEVVGESLEKEKAARRFDAPAGATAPPPPSAMDAPAASAPPAARPPSPKPAPGQGEEAGDFASRLMRAKKRAMQDRDKEPPAK